MQVRPVILLAYANFLSVTVNGSVMCISTIAAGCIM